MKRYLRIFVVSGASAVAGMNHHVGQPGLELAEQQPPRRHHAEQLALGVEDVEVDDPAGRALAADFQQRLAHGQFGAQPHEVAVDVSLDGIGQLDGVLLHAAGLRLNRGKRRAAAV